MKSAKALKAWISSEFSSLSAISLPEASYIASITKSMSLFADAGRKSFHITFRRFVLFTNQKSEIFADQVWSTRTLNIVYNWRHSTAACRQSCRDTLDDISQSVMLTLLFFCWMQSSCLRVGSIRWSNKNKINGFLTRKFRQTATLSVCFLVFCKNQITFGWCWVITLTCPASVISQASVTFFFSDRRICCSQFPFVPSF